MGWEGVPHAVQSTKDGCQLRVAFRCEDRMIETTAHSCSVETAMQQHDLLSVYIHTRKEMEHRRLSSQRRTVLLGPLIMLNDKRFAEVGLHVLQPSGHEPKLVDAQK